MPTIKTARLQVQTVRYLTSPSGRYRHQSGRPRAAPSLWVHALAVAGGFIVSFLRSRHNREIAAMALEGDGRSRRAEPSGAGVELIGLFVVALVAMALLTAGYTMRRDLKPMPQASSEPNNNLATSRTDPNTPKTYQPQNPEPDTRSSPTGSSTGIGPDSGGRPEQEPKK